MFDHSLYSYEIEEISDSDSSDEEDNWFERVNAIASWENVGTYLSESGPNSDVHSESNSPEVGCDLLFEVDVDFDLNHWQDLGSTPGDPFGSNAFPETLALNFAGDNIPPGDVLVGLTFTSKS